MREKKSASRNIASNVLGYSVSVVVAFFLTPFVVHSLGDVVFGLWSVAVSLTGYYGLLDLGVRSAVGEYTTRYWSKGDLDGVNRTLNTALLLLLAVGTLVVVACVVVAWFAPTLFNLSDDFVVTARWALLITGVGVGISLPLGLFGVATYARQRFDIANAIGISERLLVAGLTVWALKSGHGLIGLALATTGGALAMACVRMRVAFLLLPGLSLDPRKRAWGSVKELGHFGFFNFLVNAADRVITHTDLIVVGVFVTTSAVTFYAVGANLIPYYIAIVNAVAWTLTPRATSYDAHGDRDGLRRLWLGGTRGILLFAALVGGGLIFMGRDFLSLWMGEQYVAGETYTSSALILQILAVGALIRLGMTCGKQVLFGMRRVRVLGLLALGEAAANVILSIVLVRFLGLIGVAFGTLIPILVVYLWLQPRVLMRTLEVRASEFWVQVYKGPVLLLLTMGSLALLFREWLPVSTWPGFLMKATLLSLPASGIGIAVGTTTEEKRALREKLLSRLRPGPTLPGEND